MIERAGLAAAIGVLALPLGACGLGAGRGVPAQPRLTAGACIVKSLAPIGTPDSGGRAPAPQGPAVRAAVATWIEAADTGGSIAHPALTRVPAGMPRAVCAYDAGTGRLTRVVMTQSPPQG